MKMEIPFFSNTIGEMSLAFFSITQRIQTILSILNHTKVLIFIIQYIQHISIVTTLVHSLPQKAVNNIAEWVQQSLAVYTSQYSYDCAL